ncbi:LCP family protein [Streptomyces sp. NPDC059567]|uniref:LCP family protein n=1 Tax=Streptomyces sp. NPDC059567 TaxID=3346867 RepID=UPI0036A087A0
MSVRKSSRPRRLVLASAALVALASGAIAGAPAALPGPDGGLTVLVAGVDSRAGLTAAELKRYHAGGKGCDCTDVMMLVHVSARNDRVSVVSLPRDSLTAFPAGHVDQRTGKVHGAHPAKLNAAHTEGGPKHTLEAVERMTGTRVDRYLEIDFRRFMDGVDQVDGGVPICTVQPLKDPVTGIDLAPGTRNVKGGEALQYVRSRRDGDMDFGRMRKQQKFVVNMWKTIRAGVLEDPARLWALASTVRGTAETERSLSVTEIFTLAVRLRDLTPDRTEFATVPIRRFNPTITGVGSSVAWDEKRAAEIFAALRAERPLPKAPAKQTSEIPRGLGEYRPAGGASLVCP